MDLFHHPSSAILVGLVPLLRSCPSGSLLSPIVLTQNIFPSRLVSFVPALHAYSPWGSASPRAEPSCCSCPGFLAVLRLGELLNPSL